MFDTTHRNAIARLDFVGRRLPTAHIRNGYEFVPRSDFQNEGRERMVVSIDPDGTELIAVNGVTGQPYSVWFAPDTPQNVVHQAVASAMQNARI